MLYIIAAAVMVLADQLVKLWVVKNIALGAWKNFIPGLLRLTYVQNTGAAFSMMKGMRWLLVAITLVFVAAAVWMLLSRRLEGRIGHWSVAMVAGGAVGNLIDRVRLGYVVDMFETEFMNFAVFNVADCFVVIGGVLLCIYVLFIHGKEPKNDGDPEDHR